MESELNNNFANSLNLFSRHLYQNLVSLNPNRNLICSPLSIQTCAGMLRMGAEDGSETAKELDEGLKLSSSYAKEIANGFSNVLTAFEQCKVLQMANKLYITREQPVREEFNEILTNKFHTEPENIDFSTSIEAAGTINDWVESRTNKLIRNLVSPDALNESTRLVLINAIHFKGEWSVKFQESETRSEDFILENENKVKVSMMNATNNFDFADLPDLDAKALRLSYRDSDLYMLIILPNSKTGLKQLEKKLQAISLEHITSQLSLCKVIVKLPKFKAEFEQELTPVFKQLGINRIFNDAAQFEIMLESHESIYVSKILHKAFIEVNEEGTEAAAVTAMIMQVRSLPASERMPKIFHADHAFYFTIYDENHGCLFVGNFHSPDASRDADKVQLICHCK